MAMRRPTFVGIRADGVSTSQAHLSSAGSRAAHFRRWLLPFSGIGGLVGAWAAAVSVFAPRFIPGPGAVASALVELAGKGILARYVVASLYRVTWGYLSGVALGLPVGLLLGWFRRAEAVFGPLVQVLRPISPIAWTPLAILWFGIGDPPAIFVIALSTFLVITAAAAHAVAAIPETHLRVARNFDLGAWELLVRVILPASLPELVVALRLALGIAWLVVVAAEMIAVNSGLGFLIVDARNAGDRYDHVVAGMVTIGLCGLGLDAMMRRVEGVLGGERAPAAAPEGSGGAQP